MHVRDKAGKAFYRSLAWRSVRGAAMRRDFFLCRSCGEPVGMSGQVDHVLPRASHPELALDLENLQTLCVRCHGEKTREESDGSKAERKKT